MTQPTYTVQLTEAQLLALGTLLEVRLSKGKKGASDEVFTRYKEVLALITNAYSLHKNP